MSATIHIFVDGNYLFFSARTAGLTQDFAKLEEHILQKFGGPRNAQVGGKFFYTRPPGGTDPRAVLGWLRVHGWKTYVYNYDTTHQDSLYVSMVSDMWFTYHQDQQQGREDTHFVVVSGNRTLIHPLSMFPKAVALVCTPESTNKKLLDLPQVVTIPLEEMLQ